MNDHLTYSTELFTFMGDIEVFIPARPSITETEVPEDLVAQAITMD